MGSSHRLDISEAEAGFDTGPSPVTVPGSFNAQVGQTSVNYRQFYRKACGPFFLLSILRNRNETILGLMRASSGVKYELPTITPVAFEFLRRTSPSRSYISFPDRN